MIRFRSLPFALLCLLCLSSAISAQSQAHTSIELDWDTRALLTPGRRSFSGLYSGAFRLKTGLLGPGWTVELAGDRKDSGQMIPPASSDFLWQQATVEKDWGAHRLQTGLLRLPFGIYDTRETYASGLIDYPMPRSDYALNSVDWGVPGVKWTGGNASVQIETAAFEGAASGLWGKRNRVGGGALRLQAYRPDLLLGVSRWDGYLDLPVWGGAPGAVARRGVHLNGVDMRYTRPHLVLRGEYLFGVLGGQQMQGWYLDAYYRLPKYERFTLVARLEGLRPGSRLPYGRQLTLGVRYTAARDWVFAVNWRRNNMEDAYSSSWTPPSGRSGAFFFQAYHKTRL